MSIRSQNLSKSKINSLLKVSDHFLVKGRKYLILIVSFSHFACSSYNGQSNESLISTGAIQVKGYIVPKDSIEYPVVIEAGKPTNVLVGKKIEIQGKKNVMRAGVPRNLGSLSPTINTIGKDGYLMPIAVKAGTNKVLCKTPELVLVKDPYSKDYNPENFSSYSKLQGLRADQVRSMIQDKSGNLWLGTDDGLTRYDGKYFSHFTLEQGLINNLILAVYIDSNDNIWFGSYGGGVAKFDGRYIYRYTTVEGLSNDVVNCIYEDNNGNMWFGSGGGISKFDGSTFTNFSTREGLCHNDVRSIIQDNSGRLWMSTNGGGISVFDGSSFSNYSQKEGLTTDSFSTMYKDSKNNIWLCSAGGVFKFDGFSFFQFTTNEGLSDNSVRTVIEDNRGLIWVGTAQGGFSVFDGKNFTQYTEMDGLSSNFIRCSLKDDKGNLWFGTRGGGIMRFAGNIFTHLSSLEGLSQSRVMDIMEDEENNLWLGTYGGYVTKSYFREDKGIKNRVFTFYDKNDGLLSSRIYSILKDRKGNIWFGTDGGGVSKFDGKTMSTFTIDQGLCGNIIRKIYEDKEGNIWIVSYGDGVSKYNGKTFTNYTVKQGLSSNNVLTALQDSSGNMWFGTDDGGLTKLYGSNFVHYGKKEGFVSNTVYSILQDKDGNLWFGTGGEGVVIYDGKSFRSFSDSERPTNNYVMSLLQDSHGNIWFGTRFGLMVADSGNLTRENLEDRTSYTRSYGYEDGFAGIGCNLGAIRESKNGIIWIGTNDRLTAFHPEGDYADTIPPKLQLMSIQLFNETIPWNELDGVKDTSVLLKNGLRVGRFKFDGIMKWSGLPEGLSLRFDNNYLTFNYIAVSITHNNKISYQYMLQGLDEKWSAPTTKTDVSYGNLFHGDYIFKVKAMDNEGRASDEIIYPFTIRPPWWQTLGFYTLVILTICLLIYGFIRYRLQKLKYDKELLQIKVNEQVSEITLKNEELQRINAEKAKLFSIIGHDLRSPFSGFLGFTQEFAENIQNFSKDELQSIALNMKTSATNLFRLLDNLLQWARVQQGVIPFRPEELKLTNVVNESILMLLIQAKNKNIKIYLNIPVTLSVFADSNMLQVIVRNLVSNAIKFTPQGGKIYISAKEEDKKKVEIAIKDTGIGINKDMLGRMFSMDVSVNRNGTDGELSTGLGLLLCKEFAERHNGSIWVESDEGKGSVFYFTIPYLS